MNGKIRATVSLLQLTIIIITVLMPGTHKSIATSCKPRMCCSCCSWQKEYQCTICGASLTSSTPHFCDTPGCKGVYCDDCFAESKKKCCLCKRPLEYGDFSDCSEVEDSSECPDTETFREQRFREITSVHS